MVRTAGSGARPRWASDYSDGEEQDQSASEEEEVVSEEEYKPSSTKKGSKPRSRTPAKSPKSKSKAAKTPRGKISPSKTPASKRKFSRADSEEPAPKKKIKKEKPKVDSSRASGRAHKKVKYSYDSEEEEEEEDDDSEIEILDPSESEEEDYRRPAKKGSNKKVSKKSNHRLSKVVTSRDKQTHEDFPPVSEMVIESIKALKDPPRKGSTLRSIKETITLNWPVNMRIYDAKIKKFVQHGLASGQLIQTKGKGFSGRFTVKGLKPKKKKVKKEKLEKFDEDLVEYQPKKTKRDEERVKDQEEMERKRLERMIWEEKVKAEKAAERANRPKKHVVKRDTFEVESIKGKKEVNGKTYYLIQFVGFAKRSWEPEENVSGCPELVDAFEEEERQKEAEMAEIKRLAEEEGIYEVHRILEVKFNKDKTREFLIRWKGTGPEGDTWEPEANLDCKDLIEVFMAKWEKVVSVDAKSLREAPKKVQRLAFSNSARVGKRNQGFRVTYEDMDE